MLIGAHMSIAGGAQKAIARGEKVGCTAIQIFTKNASRWAAKPIEEQVARDFRNAWEASSVESVIAHDSYLINLASPDDNLWERSLAAFVDEMERCALLGVPALVMHPGAHLGAGEEAGIARVAEAFRRIFAESSEEVTVLLENTAGQGSTLGRRFEELAAIMEQVPEGRFGVCLDTCHAFAAGYDLSSAEGYRSVMEEFDRLIGTGRIGAFHLNDSKKGLGGRVDRHAHIGEGEIGTEGFAALLQDDRFTAVPKVLETPKGENDEWDVRNLALLRSLAGKGPR